MRNLYRKLPISPTPALPLIPIHTDKLTPITLTHRPQFPPINIPQIAKSHKTCPIQLCSRHWFLLLSRIHFNIGST